jgi:hypothetical protein
MSAGLACKAGGQSIWNMLKLNLFHEIQRLEFERKWDPVKITIYVLVFGLLVIGALTALRYMGYRPSREQVASYQKELADGKKALEEAELRLKDLPLYQSEFGMMKRRAEQKPLKSKQLEVIKAAMPTNLFVQKLTIDREVTSEKVPGPKNKKGQSTFVLKTTSFGVIRFDANYSAPSKPMALEMRDRLVEDFRRNEILADIAADLKEEGVTGNKVKMTSFSTTEPVGNEPAVATIGIEVELEK